MLHTWVLAIDRSILVWIGMCILLNKWYKWYELSLFIILTSFFRHYVYMFLGDWMRPLLFLFSLLLLTVGKAGLKTDKAKNFFNLALVFMIIILSKTWVRLLMEFLHIYDLCMDILGNSYFCLTHSYQYTSLFFEAIITVTIFFLVQAGLEKTKINKNIGCLDYDYRKLLVIGTGLLLGVYYAMVLIPILIGFDCSGIIYMQPIQITLISFITAALVCLFYSITRKERELAQKGKDLTTVTNRYNKTKLEIEEITLVKKDLEIQQVEDQKMIISLENKAIESFEQMKYVQYHMGKFIHEQSNSYIGLVGMIESGDKEALDEFFDQYGLNIKSISENFKCYEIDKLKASRFAAIRKVLYFKMDRARDWDIKFNIEIPEEIHELGITSMDAVKILGNWLDNALEEAVNTKEKWVHISFLLVKGSIDTLEIRVSNSCRSEALEPEEACKLGISTKGEGRGFGLAIIEEIKEENDHIYISTTKDDLNGVFLQTLLIEFDQSEDEDSDLD